MSDTEEQRPATENHVEESDEMWTKDSVYAWLDAGGAVDKRDCYNRTPFFAIAQYSDGKSLAYAADLLRRGVDPYAPARYNFSSDTPFVVAVKSGNTKLVEMMVALAPRDDISKRAAKAIKYVKHLDMLRLLVELGALEHYTGPSFWGSCISDDLSGERTRFLLSKGFTPAMLVTGEWLRRFNHKYSSMSNVVVALLQAGADPTQEDEEGELGLVKQALRSGRITMARMLLRAGASNRGCRGYQQMLVDILAGDREAVRKRLQKKPPLQQKSMPPVLFVAAAMEEYEILEDLIDAGYKMVKGENYTFEVAVYRAATDAKYRLLDILLDKGVIPTRCLSIGDSILENGSWRVAKYIRRRGVPLGDLCGKLLSKGPHEAILWVFEEDLPLTEPELNRLYGYTWTWHAFIAEGPKGPRDVRIQVLDRLLKLGWDPSLVGTCGSYEATLLEMAEEYGQEDLAAWFFEHDVRPLVSHPIPDWTNASIALWRERLERYRRDWPEWERLEALAYQEGLEWFEHNDKSWLRLPGGLCVRADPEVTTVPEWLIALDGLCHHPNTAGGLADWATGPVPDILAAELLHGRRTSVPESIRMLQMTPTGVLLCVDADEDVVVWKRNRFVKIGPFEPFVRHCLRCWLDGIDWYDAMLKHGFEGMRKVTIPEC